MKVEKMAFYLALSSAALSYACSNDSLNCNCNDKQFCIDNICHTKRGESCDANAPCEPGFSCQSGLCQKDMSQQPCGNTHCVPPQVCNQESLTCVNPSKLGESCSKSQPCQQGLLCDAQSSRCIEDKGQGCNAHSDCQAPQVCDLNLKRCVNSAQLGEACGPNVALCQEGVCQDGFCKKAVHPLHLLDSDGDGISDYYEVGIHEGFSQKAARDSDSDLVPDYLDEDSNGNGYLDSVEAQVLLDKEGKRYKMRFREGTAEILDEDDQVVGQYFQPETGQVYNAQNEAVSGLFLFYPDVDGDGTPTFLDLDNDNDDTNDNVEITGVFFDKIRRKCLNQETNVLDWCPQGTPEQPWDSDGDTLPDYLDIDSDNDGLLDSFEGLISSNSEGIFNRFNLDSDGDGLLDNEEVLRYEKDYRALFDVKGQPLKNAEGRRFVLGPDGRLYTLLDDDSLERNPEDNSLLSQENSFVIGKTAFFKALQVCILEDCSLRNYCYRVTDCDRDGLVDTHEPWCDLKWAGAQGDSDGDGHADASEHAAALYAMSHNLLINGAPLGNPAELICNPDKNVKNVFDFYFELPYAAPETKDDELIFKPVVSKLDLIFNMDTTGSMGNEVANLKERIGTYVVPETRQRVLDSAFGVSAFDDFPISPYGGGSDRPFHLLGKVSDDLATVINNVHKLSLRSGGDGPESGYQSLWQILMGDDKSFPLTTWPGGSSSYNTPAEGRWGGVDFRQGSLPVVVHITDVYSHDHNIDAYNDSIQNPYYSPQVHKAYQTKGARIISIYRNNGLQLPQLLNSSQVTQAIVPACAFKTPTGDWICGENRCCTVAENPSTGTAPIEGNRCVLSYGIKDAKTLSSTLIDGVDALVKYGTYEVSTRIRGESIADSSVNTSCFLKRVEALRYVAPPQEPEQSCNPTATPTSIDAVGYNNGFKNFSPGSSSNARPGAELVFKVIAHNDNCVEPKPYVQTFKAYIDVINPVTNLVFDTRQVSILVPAKPEAAIN